MFTRSFWLDTAERLVKTFSQALAAIFMVSGVTILNADWATALATAGTATLLSLLTSLASAVKTAKVDDEEPVRTASLLKDVNYTKVGV